jgi:hypothetical protein
VLCFRRISCWLILCLILAGCETTAPYVYRYIPGRTATAQRGYAIAPAHAPPVVQQAIQREMRSSAGPIVMEGGIHPFTIQLTIAPEQPLISCMRLGDCRHPTLRTSFGSMGKTAQETGLRFTRLAGMSFWSLPASASTRDGGMVETVLTGRRTAGRPTGTYGDTHPGCKSILRRPAGRVAALTWWHLMK